MGRDPREQRKAQAASYFIARAEEAVRSADTARSEDAMAALYKEAETWLYMAGQCLNPDRQGSAPPVLRAPSGAPREPRSFSRDD
jgi:hypothetical protein